MPNFMHVYDFLETQKNYYLVLTLCDQNLYDIVYTHPNKRLDVMDAVFYLQQIMNGMYLLVKDKVIMRDFKLDNIFLKNEDQVVIGEPGFLDNATKMVMCQIGLDYHLAPECFFSAKEFDYSNNNKCYIWSIGIIFHMMLYGANCPFNAMSYADLKNEIQNHSGDNTKFDDSVGVSEDAKDFIRKCLVKDISDRIEWKDLFNHKLFKSDCVKDHMKKHQDNSERLAYSKEVQNAFQWLKNDLNGIPNEASQPYPFDIVDPLYKHLADKKNLE